MKASLHKIEGKWVMRSGNGTGFIWGSGYEVWQDCWRIMFRIWG